MATTFTESVTLERLSCGSCGGVFALNYEVLQHARNNAGGYNCPYCRERWSWTKTEAQRLREQLEQAQRELRQEKCNVMTERQMRESVELENNRLGKKLKRVHKGTCPCCKRHFENLQRHMETKHPEATKKA